MLNIELEQLINKKFNSEAFKDYAPNGLQVEGRKEVNRIITGVTASQALLDCAVAKNADAVMVHHGLFWKNETLIVRSMKKTRLKTLLSHDINLYAWHLPLDIHPTIGNNTQLADALGIQIIGSLDPLVLHGEFKIPIDGKKLLLFIEQVLDNNVLHYNYGPIRIKRVAWSTGAGQKFIELAAQSGMDAFITGEVSEQTIHISKEEKICFYAAGHHATERGGIQALGNWLIQKYNFDVTFIDIPNPA